MLRGAALAAPAAPAALAVTTPSLAVLHRRLAHPGRDVLRMVRTGKFGVHVPAGDAPPCAACIESKIQHAPQPKVADLRAVGPMDLMISDMLTSTVPSLARASYARSFIDNATGFCKVYTMQQHSEDAVLDTLVKLFGLAGQLGLHIGAIRFDGDKACHGPAVKKLLRQHGTGHQSSAAYTPQQVGQAERMWRTLTERARCMRLDARLPEPLWAELLQTACYITNRLPSPRLAGRAPLAVLTGKPVRLDHLRAVGSICYIKQELVPKGHKVQSRAPVRGILVGYAAGYADGVLRVWTPHNNHVVVTQHVSIVGEPVRLLAPLDAAKELLDAATAQLPSTSSPSTSTPGVAATATLQGLEPTDVGGAGPVPAGSAGVVTGVTAEDLATADWLLLPNGIPIDTPAVTTWLEVPQAMAVADSGLQRLSTALVAMVASTASSGDPGSYKEAMAGPGAAKWAEACMEEIQQLLALESFSYVPLPKGRVPVGSRWVFKTKRGAHGEITRYKARFVAKGFSQVPGTDFKQTFAPVVQMSTLRVVMALAVQHGWELEQLDVPNAFCHSPVNEEVYVRAPEGFVRCDGAGRPMVLRLHRSLYGLKQAPRNWHKTLVEQLCNLGFTPCDADPCVFISKDGVILLVYVDDLVLTGSADMAVLRRVVAALEDKFSIKSLGALYCDLENFRVP
jgi:hypothetical protein